MSRPTNTSWAASSAGKGSAGAPDEDSVVGAQQAKKLHEIPRPLRVKHHGALTIGVASQAHGSIDGQRLKLRHADRTRIAQILHHAGREGMSGTSPLIWKDPRSRPAAAVAKAIDRMTPGRRIGDAGKTRPRSGHSIGRPWRAAGALSRREGVGLLSSFTVERGANLARIRSGSAHQAPPVSRTMGRRTGRDAICAGMRLRPGRGRH